MTRGEARFVHLGTALVGLTGLVYGWMLYFEQPTDEFAVVNHPLQPDLQHAHILFAPLFVFACALIWREHVWTRVRSTFPVRRRSGLLLTGLLFPMILSGYLLQVTTEPTWQRAWVWTHVVSSCVWLAGYLLHWMLPRSRAERPERAA